MKKIILLNTLILLGFAGFAQLSIEDCYRRAIVRYPQFEQAEWIEKAKAYNLSNANSAYLPQITFSAKATYQSDVTELPAQLLQNLNLPAGVGVMDKDQYGATININQVIWDGGATKSRKEQIRASSNIEWEKRTVDLYALIDRVNQLFFGILLLDAQIEQNRLFQEELQRTYDKISVYVENGIANQADLDAVKVDESGAIESLANEKSTHAFSNCVCYDTFGNDSCNIGRCHKFNKTCTNRVF